MVGAASASRRAELSDTIAKVFLEIVKFPTDDPRICQRQIAFMIDVMAAEATESGLRILLRDEVLAHVRRMTDRLSALSGSKVIRQSAQPSA